MKEVKKAKERAEIYLRQVIKSRWEEFTAIPENEKISYCWDDWPILFEAYAYLGNRYKELIPEYAKQVRYIWTTWLENYKKSGTYHLGIFWPIIEQYFIPYGDPDNADWEPGNAGECHVAMFRAKETFDIIGFDEYFDNAKNRIKEGLLGRALSSPYVGSIKWGIVRSPTLRLLLKDSIRIVASEFIEHRKNEPKLADKKEIPEEFKNIKVVSFDGGISEEIFFLILSNNVFEEITSILKDLANQQGKDGSFDSNIFKTCLYISCLNLLKLDRHRTISEPAINWLIRKQNDDGSWSHWEEIFGGKSIGFRILITVFILETIDIASNDEPAPIWATLEAPQNFPKKQLRIQEVPQLKAPPGINWSDVSIFFTSDLGEDVEIRAGENRFGIKNFREIGFNNKKTNSPDKLWETLKTLARCDGEISWRESKASKKDKMLLKSHIRIIRYRLKYLFNIEDDPFIYKRNTKSYVTKFRISHLAERLD